MPGAEPVRIERRSGQRFAHAVAVALRVPEDNRSGSGFTQDLSSRGALIWTDLLLTGGQWVDMSLQMPAAITLGDDMNVCCHARVVRVERRPGEARSAVALQIEKYDFSPQARVVQQHLPVQPARL
jgi:PilZ domain